jgi:hypothetical protein
MSHNFISIGTMFDMLEVHIFLIYLETLTQFLGCIWHIWFLYMLVVYFLFFLNVITIHSLGERIEKKKDGVRGTLLNI